MCQAKFQEVEGTWYFLRTAVSLAKLEQSQEGCREREVEGAAREGAEGEGEPWKGYKQERETWSDLCIRKMILEATGRQLGSPLGPG